LSRFSFLTRGRAALLGAGLVLVIGGAACDEAPPSETVQNLVAPPGVPEAPAPSQTYIKVRLEATEIEKEIAPGVKYTLWTFNDSVPGPLIRAHEGDTVEITLHNAGTSTVTHNIDLHAVTGPGGGADVTNVAPGETKVFTFKALSSGLFTYHCAAGLVADHIANGMYGGILVEPRNGLPKVDHEYYVGQSDMYTDGATNEPGSMKLDLEKLLAEQPTYVVFNGHTKALAGNNALTAKAGETVRIYFVDGGPNLTSSFHVIGEIFDKAWAWGSLETLPAKGVQTISVPPGGAVIVQFKADVPGDYKLVDHALGRVAKGAVGVLKVTGANDEDIFGVPGGMPTAISGHEMTHTPTTDAGVEVPAGGTTTVTMTDSKFEPKAFTVKAGSSVTFETPNKGKLPHNMRIATLAGDYSSPQSVATTPEIVNGGATGKLTWTAPSATGTYKFRCDVHPADMTGTITVQ
jgi:nitrite reductase (NO-forming)